jgi:hypothetical protein
MQAAPDPETWEAPIEDTAFTAWLGFDGRWHLAVDAPGWHPYVASVDGADLVPLPVGGAAEDTGYWSNDLTRVDCRDCQAAPWWPVAIERGGGQGGRRI